MTSPRNPLHSILLKSASMIVPRDLRREWRAEWESELWYVLRECDGQRAAVGFCLGAFRDALWVRRNHDGQVRHASRRLQSPLRCLLFLASMAAIAVTAFLRAHGPFDEMLHAARGQQVLLLPHLFMIAIGLLVTSISTSFSLGEYPAGRSSPAHARRFLRRTFLALKFALMVAVVFCGTFDLAPLLGASGLQPHAALIGYVVAFRWILVDQRRRCPVCLRLLHQSTSIGEFSHNFLEWYGSELFCAEGHGMLHVPAIATTYDTQRWVDLDRSWSVLFSRGG